MISCAVLKQVFQLIEEIAFRAKMGNVFILCLRFFSGDIHFMAVITMKTITFDDGRFNALVAENKLESSFHI